MIEVDGSQHAQNTPCDADRTAYIHAAGYRLLRFWDNDVLLAGTDVMQAIYNALDFSPHPDPLPENPGRGDNEG